MDGYNKFSPTHCAFSFGFPIVKISAIFASYTDTLSTSDHHSSILSYYDQLAPTYDEHRFGNTYGQFIHRQEQALLKRLLSSRQGPVLDVGCGTGRLLDFATHGVDISPNMVEVAQQKFPDKSLQISDGDAMPFDASLFNTLFSFHVVMHLNVQKTHALLTDAHRVLKPGGRFIFDFPSGKRRQLTRTEQPDWHGANELTLSDIRELSSTQWKVRSVTGILFLPIHRFPKAMRMLLVKPDQWLNRSPFKEYASYLAIELEKQ